MSRPAAMTRLLVIASLSCLLASTRAQRCKRLSTFNTFFIQSSHGDYKPRVPRVAKALQSSDADVLCLQEVWLEDDMTPLLNAVGRKFPYHYSVLHYSVGNLHKPPSKMSWWERFTFSFRMTGPCGFEDTFNLMTAYQCLSNNGCLDKKGNEVLYCASQKCVKEIKQVSADCVTCVGVTGAGSDLNTILNACSYRFGNHRLNGPGLMLLSKSPLSSVRYRDYWPNNRMSVKRGYIEAQVPGLGQIVCTHLTSLWPKYFEYDTIGLGSFLAQQAVEIDKLKQAFRGNHILLGDLNSGPAVTSSIKQANLKGEGTGNYQMLINNGYRETYMSEDGRCTYCNHNVLTSNYSNNVIDHVMVKGGGVTLRDSKRVLDNISPSPLSDHFGASAVACPAT